MAKISQYTAETNPSADDDLLMEDYGTGATKKIARNVLLSSKNLTVLPTVSVADTLSITDDTDGIAKKISITGLINFLSTSSLVPVVYPTHAQMVIDTAGKNPHFCQVEEDEIQQDINTLYHWTGAALKLISTDFTNNQNRFYVTQYDSAKVFTHTLLSNLVAYKTVRIYINDVNGNRLSYSVDRDDWFELERPSADFITSEQLVNNYKTRLGLIANTVIIEEYNLRQELLTLENSDLFWRGNPSVWETLNSGTIIQGVIDFSRLHSQEGFGNYFLQLSYYDVYYDTDNIVSSALVVLTNTLYPNQNSIIIL